MNITANPLQFYAVFLCNLIESLIFGPQNDELNQSHFDYNAAPY